MELTYGGRWYATLPEKRWDLAHSAEAVAMIKRCFDPNPRVGDRRQEIVFIGVKPPEQEIVALLDSLLVTDAEWKGGRKLWNSWPDPFDGWSASEDDESSEEEEARERRHKKHHRKSKKSSGRRKKHDDSSESTSSEDSEEDSSEEVEDEDDVEAVRGKMDDHGKGVFRAMAEGKKDKLRVRGKPEGSTVPLL